MRYFFLLTLIFFSLNSISGCAYIQGLRDQHPNPSTAVTSSTEVSGAEVSQSPAGDASRVASSLTQ